jgi:hypothetical protein
MTLYPDGYGTEMVTIEKMIAKHGPKMHPEFKRRFFAYIEYKGGLLGVGGGWRSISQISAASAAGKSFHQDQKFASGITAYCAVDLVTTDGPDANNTHDGVTWEMTADAPTYGLHTFIKVPNEPWHIQPKEIRGWQTWVDAGRPDPQFFALPGTTPPPTGLPMRYYATPPADRPNKPHLVVWDGAVRYRANPDQDPLPSFELNSEQYDWMLKCANLA